MRRQLHLFFTLLLLAVSSVAWAQKTGTVTFGSAKGSINITSESVTGTDDLGNSWTISTKGTSSFTPNAGYAQIGSSKKPATSITLTMSLAEEQTFTSVSANFGGFGSTAGDVKINVDGTSIASGSLNADNDVTVSGENLTASGKTLTISITNIAKGVKIYSISYTLGSGETAIKAKAPSLTESASSLVNPFDVTITNNEKGATVYYTTDGTDPTTSSASFTGASKNIQISATTTVKAMAVVDGKENSTIASATYTFIPSFTSLEDLAAADIAAGTTVKVSFDNVPIKSIYVTKSGNRNGVYFDIQKDSKDIEIFYHDVPTEWVAGGKVSGTMTCPWTVYNGTWELAPEEDSWSWDNLNYVAPEKKSLTKIVVSGTPTKTTYTEGDAFDPSGLVVTGTYSDNTQQTITEGIEWTIDPETLTAGTTSVDVMATVEEVISKVYTVNGITVTEKPAAETYELVTDATTLKEGDVITFVNTAAAAAIGTQKENNFGQVTIVIDNNQFTSVSDMSAFTLEGSTDSWYFKTSNNEYLYAASSSSNYLRTEADKDNNAKAKITIERGATSVVFQGTNTRKVLQYNSGSTLFSCYGSASQNPIDIYRKVTSSPVVEDVTLTIGETGYATLYYGDRALTVPAGVEAYTYSVSDNKLAESYVYEVGEVIPAGEAVVIKGEAKEYTFAASTEAGETDSDNQLKGFDEAYKTTDASSLFYILSTNKDDDPKSVGFYWQTEDGTGIDIPAHKAYLQLPVSAAKISFFLFDDEATAIDSVVEPGIIVNKPMYNLAGQRVSKNYKGVVIQNGKKYIRK